jgi:hypothetical protein
MGGLMQLDTYKRYLEALDSVPFTGRFMPYEWGQLPKSLHFQWFAYGMMFGEFSREIANSINDLTNHTHSLKAWHTVLSSMTEDDRLDTLHGAIDPLATVSLNLPHVIRSRFIFATAHLCHQANQSSAGWRDDLKLDGEIYMDEAIRCGQPWKKFNRLQRTLERLYDRKYQRSTHDFRNAYSHRFSPRVGLGLTQVVDRSINSKSKQVTYTYRILEPLKLDFLTDLLTEQCEHSYAAFEAFQILVSELETCIR